MRGIGTIYGRQGRSFFGADFDLLRVPVEEAASRREVPLKARTTKPLDHSSPL